MMNQSKENQSGCEERTRSGEEGIDDILEALETYVCDELCCHRSENLTQEEMDWYCCHCELSKYTDRVRERGHELRMTEYTGKDSKAIGEALKILILKCREEHGREFDCIVGFGEMKLDCHFGFKVHEEAEDADQK